MDSKLKNLSQSLLYLTVSAILVYISVLITDVTNSIIAEQKQQTILISQTKENFEDKIDKYERLALFTFAKFAQDSVYNSEKYYSFMDQIVQDEADSGDVRLAKLMSLLMD